MYSTCVYLSYFIILPYKHTRNALRKTFFEKKFENEDGVQSTQSSKFCSVSRFFIRLASLEFLKNISFWLNDLLEGISQGDKSA